MNARWVAPVMPDYDSARAVFSWRRERSRLAGLPDGGINIGFEAVDRHLREGHGERAALRCIARDGSVRTLSFAGLAAESSRFAHVLETLGTNRGERVFTLLGRRFELYSTVLGTLRAGRVLCPLFSAFGPEPVALRMELGNARVLVTTRELYQRKVAPVRSRLPHLRHVLLLDPGADPPPDTLSFPALTAAAPDAYTVGPTDPAEPALLHFTSGTTGTPKGAVHVHEAVLAHHVTAAYALDLHEGDVFWCTADPGWVTGMSYGIIAPLTHGVTTVVDEGDFAPTRWYGILADQHVTVWYTAPTALRMLMRATPRGGESAPATRHDLSSLRFVASVGEPLNPEAVHWGRKALGLPVHDTWWQTETGAIMIANFAADPVRPGSMGRPIPGVEAAVLACGDVAVSRSPAVRMPSARPVTGSCRFHASTSSFGRYRSGSYMECARNRYVRISRKCGPLLARMDSTAPRAAFSTACTSMPSTGRQLAAQHSHSLEGWYAHIPGIRVLAPATVDDARHVLSAALTDPDPVLLFEHGSLYSSAGTLDPAVDRVDLDRAAVRREGTDVTVVAYGGCVSKALEAAEQLSGEGVSAEVVDLRTLRPLDDATIVGSVRRTHRAVVVDEGWRSGSLSAEIESRICEQAFFELDAPVERVCSAEVPIPYARRLEEAALPQPAGIVAAAHRVVT